MRDPLVASTRALTDAVCRWRFQMHNRMWSDNNVYGELFPKKNHLTPGVVCVRRYLYSIYP